MVSSQVVQYFEGKLDPAPTRPASWSRPCTRSSGTRTRGAVSASGPTPTPARTAPGRAGSARQGVGLVRTEHMFLGERRQLVERLILADDGEERQAALDALEPLQRGDFVEILEAMDGLPVTIRLIDPPLHEFLPDLTELSVKVALAGRRGHREGPQAARRGAQAARAEPDARACAASVSAWSSPACSPCRCGRSRTRRPTAGKAGGDPQPEIMIPLVGAVQELEIAREEAEKVLAQVAEETGTSVHTLIGTMIEVPRAALTAGQIAAGGRVLLLRHQRPDPDGLGLLPRRRGGLVLQPLHRPGHLRRVAVRDDRHRRRRQAGRASRSRRAAPPGRTSRSASAASTAVTRSRCTSSTRPGSTTCPARRSGCRSPGSRPAAPPCSPPTAAATAGEPTEGQRRRVTAR